MCYLYLFIGLFIYLYNRFRSRERKCAENNIVINDTVNLFSKTAISILVISRHNSFRVPFDKIVSKHFTSKIYLYFSIGNGQPREPALCQLYRHTFIPYGLSLFVINENGWLGSRVVSVLDSDAEGPGFKSQSRRCRVTVLSKLFTPIVPVFTKQQNWQQPS